jgi:hypothetical protein
LLVSLDDRLFCPTIVQQPAPPDLSKAKVDQHIFLPSGFGSTHTGSRIFSEALVALTPEGPAEVQHLCKDEERHHKITSIMPTWSSIRGHNPVGG